MSKERITRELSKTKKELASFVQVEKSINDHPDMEQEVKDKNLKYISNRKREINEKITELELAEKHMTVNFAIASILSDLQEDGANKKRIIEIVLSKYPMSDILRNELTILSTLQDKLFIEKSNALKKRIFNEEFGIVDFDKSQWNWTLEDAIETPPEEEDLDNEVDEEEPEEEEPPTEEEPPEAEEPPKDDGEPPKDDTKKVFTMKDI